MKFTWSVATVVIAFFVLFSSVSALHIQVEHEAPNEFTFTFSSLKSSSCSSFPDANVLRPALHLKLEASDDEFTITFSSLKSSSSGLFPNAFVAIYSGQYDVKMKETDESDIYDTDTGTGTCPAPLATYNNTVNTRINLTKSPNCTLNLLLRVRDVLDHKWSQANTEFKDEPIVLKVGCNKPNVEVPTYNNSQITSHVFTWGDIFVFSFLALTVGVTVYSVSYFNNYRRERGHYFDQYDLDHERRR
ncbi:uncharacterized protein LOC141595793 [Silene latifolia]|uniref:uncharacterized protein LOC141595793 n=1 Tax=Silene latifolia TaxID=37657 RepID=UPI003D773360